MLTFLKYFLTNICRFTLISVIHLDSSVQHKTSFQVFHPICECAFLIILTIFAEKTTLPFIYQKIQLLIFVWTNFHNFHQFLLVCISRPWAKSCTVVPTLLYESQNQLVLGDFSQIFEFEQNCWSHLGMVVSTFNLITQEEKAWRSLWIWGLPGLQSEALDTLESTEAYL